MDSNSKSLIEMAEQAGKLTATGALSLLTISIFYDYSFFWALNLSFNEIPSSTAEHVRSALLWIPSLSLYFLGFALMELFSKIRQKTEEEEEELPMLSNGNISLRGLMFSKRENRILFMTIFSFLIADIFLSSDLNWLYYTFIYGWVIFSVFLITRKNLRVLFNRPGRMAFFFLPFIFGLVGSFGYSSGMKLLQGPLKWELTTKIGTTTNKEKLVGIRRFSSFAVIVTQDRSVIVIPNDSILSAKLISKSFNPQANSCRWMNINCR